MLTYPPPINSNLRQGDDGNQNWLIRQIMYMNSHGPQFGSTVYLCMCSGNTRSGPIVPKFKNTGVLWGSMETLSSPCLAMLLCISAFDSGDGTQGRRSTTVDHPLALHDVVADLSGDVNGLSRRNIRQQFRSKGYFGLFGNLCLLLLGNWTVEGLMRAPTSHTLDRTLTLPPL